MKITSSQREKIKAEVVQSLCQDPEITRIVIFGSFLNSNQPNDIDIAIFQNSQEKYLPLAMKYRSRLDHLASQIALDVIPLRVDAPQSSMLDEVARGEILYER